MQGDVFVRPLRIPEHVPLCIADPPAVRVGETRTLKLRFTLTQDVPRGAELSILFHGGRHVKGVFAPLQFTDPQAPGYIKVARQDGTAIAVVALRTGKRCTAVLRVPEDGLQAGETIEATLQNVTAPEDSLHNKMFWLFLPQDEPISGVPTVNAEPDRLIVGACLVHIIGGRLARLRAWGSSQVLVDSDFSLLIRPLDRYGNLASEAPGKLAVRVNGEAVRVQRVQVAGTTCCRLEGIRIHAPGVYRLEVEDTSRSLKVSSNPIRVLEKKSRKFNVYWGYIHGHTEMSDGAGSLDNYFTYMRDTCGLDFGALGDHDHLFETSDEMWRASQEATARYNEPKRFITFLGYEWAKWRRNGDGDRNVYYLEDRRPMYRSDGGHYPTPKALFKALRDEKAIVIPHHTAAAANHCDFKDHDAGKERLIEIYSVWGNSERSVHDGNPYPVKPLRAVGGEPLDAGEEPLGFVQRALALGWRVGFTGGGDDHTGHPGAQRYALMKPWRYSVGLFSVLARAKTRRAIWDALWNRRCVATTGARILVDFEVAGAVMGSELYLEDQPELMDARTIRVTVHGTASVERIEVVRNNQEVYVHQADSPDVSFEWTDADKLDTIALPPTIHSPRPFCFYYLRVTQSDREMAWASPVWIEL